MLTTCAALAVGIAGDDDDDDITSTCAVSHEDEAVLLVNKDKMGCTCCSPRAMRCKAFINLRFLRVHTLVPIVVLDTRRRILFYLGNERDIERCHLSRLDLKSAHLPRWPIYFFIVSSVCCMSCSQPSQVGASFSDPST